jgi:opacity protein-like surface antigen
VTPIAKAACVGLMVGLAGAARVHAQAFISPFVAADFGADTGCLNLLVCADRYLNAGVGIGRIGRSYGVEEEVAFAKDFFGKGPNLSSHVLTLMSNAILSRHLGRWNPYAEGGVGVMRTYIQFTQASFYATDRTTAAWDVGGGAATYFTPRLGMRADGRYLRSFKDVRLSGFTVSDSKMGFGRASAALIVRF